MKGLKKNIEKYSTLSFIELMNLFKNSNSTEEKDFFITLANQSLKRDFQKVIK